MDFKVEGNHERLIVRVIGPVTAECGDELKQSLLELSQRRPQVLTLDLSQMPYIDSSSLGVLVGLRTVLSRTGTQLTLSAPQPRVHEVLRITQLGALFQLPS